MGTWRETHQAELHEALEALGELADEHDAALRQVQDSERDVLILRATLSAERDVSSRAELEKVALSARIDSITADLASATSLVTNAELNRTRAETLLQGMCADLHATQAILADIRAANVSLEREVGAAGRASQLHEAQLHRQAEEFRDLHSELTKERDKHLEQATRAAGAERALEALERVMARNAGDAVTGASPKRSRRGLSAASQADTMQVSPGPGTVQDDLMPRLAA